MKARPTTFISVPLQMQQMVRLGATGVNKVLDTKQPAGFLTVHTLKAATAQQQGPGDISVAFNSTTVTQGGRTTGDTNVEAITPGGGGKGGHGTSGIAPGSGSTAGTGDNSNSSGDPDRSSSPEFPSDTEAAAGEHSSAITAPLTARIGGGQSKKPAKTGGRSPNFVFRDIRQRVTQRQAPRSRGKTEMIAPKLAAPPKQPPQTERLPRRSGVAKAPTAKPDLIDLTPESPNMPLKGNSTSRSMPEVDRPGSVSSVNLPSASPAMTAHGLHHFVLPALSQPILNTTAALQTILLAKELNDEIRLLFAQRASSGAGGETTAPTVAVSPPVKSVTEFGPVASVLSTNSAAAPYIEPVWLPRVPFPVRFDELPSSLLQPFTGRTPLDNSNDWRYIDQESLKSPNSSVDGTQTTTTPTNRSSFSSPLPPLRSAVASPQSTTGIVRNSPALSPLEFPITAATNPLAPNTERSSPPSSMMMTETGGGHSGRQTAAPTGLHEAGGERYRGGVDAVRFGAALGAHE